MTAIFLCLTAETRHILTERKENLEGCFPRGHVHTLPRDLENGLWRGET